jgi:hypothetical protein
VLRTRLQIFCRHFEYKGVAICICVHFMDKISQEQLAVG